MSTGTWYHLVVTRTAGATRLYLNGVEATSGSQTQTDIFTINQIGRYCSGQPTENMFSGAIDEVLIINRSLSSIDDRTLRSGEVNSSFIQTELLQKA
jgi:hypothetical protein